MKTFGERIRELRKSANVTQEDLAEILDVSRNTICNWENDCTSPNSQYLKKLCEFFNIEIDYFFDNSSVTSEQAPCDALSKNEIDLSAKIKRIKIATISVGVLLTVFIIFFIIIFSIAVSNKGMDGYSETVSSTSYNFTSILYSSIAFVSVSFICFCILLTIYVVLCRKRRMQNNLCNDL